MPTAARPAQAHSHPNVGGPAGDKPKLYNPRHPERTLLYQTIAEHFETAGQFDGQGDHHTPKPYVRQVFRKYLECGIFAHGFARARCDECGHDYFVAFSCKGRGVCPSCNTRRMAETAAHLTDHVFPRLAVRQWVLSVPKRLRYFTQRDGAVLNLVLRIFLRVIAQNLCAHCPGTAQTDREHLHIGAVAFIHRFGSSLNEHVHFHVCVVDGVFEEVAGDVDTDAQSSPTCVIFHPASGIDEAAVAQVQATLRQRILRAFVGRGLLERHAGHRCGMTVVMRRWVRVSKSSQTGIWRRNRRRTMRSISVSTGNSARRRLDTLRGVATCVADSRQFCEQGYRQTCGSAAQTSGCEGRFGIPNPCLT